MFTGIIEKLGIVKAMRRHKNLIILDVDAGGMAKAVKLGDSVSVCGVCLTVTAKRGKVISFDLMKETIEKTSLKVLANGHGVNLELALKANSRFGGHFVTGHVDETGFIRSMERKPNWVAITVTASKTIRKHLVPKGSVTLDGISLTVGRLGKADFSVYLVPYTLKATNLSAKKPGDCSVGCDNY